MSYGLRADIPAQIPRPPPGWGCCGRAEEVPNELYGHCPRGSQGARPSLRRWCPALETVGQPQECWTVASFTQPAVATVVPCIRMASSPMISVTRGKLLTRNIQWKIPDINNR